MAKAKAKTSDCGATIGFEAKLWLAADKLRNNNSLGTRWPPGYPDSRQPGGPYAMVARLFACRSLRLRAYFLIRLHHRITACDSPSHC